jgi:hypothetical protein
MRENIARVLSEIFTHCDTQEGVWAAVSQYKALFDTMAKVKAELEF